MRGWKGTPAVAARCVVPGTGAVSCQVRSQRSDGSSALQNSWTQRFSPADVEEAFMQSRMQEFPRAFQKCCFSGMAVSCLGMFIAQACNSCYKSGHMVFLLAILLLSILGLVSLNKRFANSMDSRAREYCAVAYFNGMLVCATFLDVSLLDKLFTIDSGTLLLPTRTALNFSMFGVLAMSHFVVPVRWVNLVCVEALSIVLHASIVAVDGFSIWPLKVFELLLITALTICLAAGKRRLEMYERISFLEFQKEGGVQGQDSKYSPGTLIGNAGAGSTEWSMTSILICQNSSSSGVLPSSPAKMVGPNSSSSIVDPSSTSRSVAPNSSSSIVRPTPSSNASLTYTCTTGPSTQSIVQSPVNAPESVDRNTLDTCDMVTQTLSTQLARRDAETQTMRLSGRPPALPMQSCFAMDGGLSCSSPMGQEISRPRTPANDDAARPEAAFGCSGPASIGNQGRNSATGSALGSTSQELPEAWAERDSRRRSTSVASSSHKSYINYQPRWNIDGSWVPVQPGDWLAELDVCGDLCVDGSGMTCCLTLTHGDLLFCGGVLTPIGHYMRYERRSGATITYVYMGPTRQDPHRFDNAKVLDYGLNGCWQPIKTNQWLSSLSIQGDQVIDGTGTTVSLKRLPHSEVVGFRGGTLRLIGEYLIYYGRNGATSTMELAPATAMLGLLDLIPAGGVNSVNAFQPAGPESPDDSPTAHSDNRSASASITGSSQIVESQLLPGETNSHIQQPDAATRDVQPAHAENETEGAVVEHPKLQTEGTG